MRTKRSKARPRKVKPIPEISLTVSSSILDSVIQDEKAALEVIKKTAIYSVKPNISRPKPRAKTIKRCPPPTPKELIKHGKFSS